MEALQFFLFFTSPFVFSFLSHSFHLFHSFFLLILSFFLFFSLFFLDLQNIHEIVNAMVYLIFHLFWCLDLQLLCCSEPRCSKPRLTLIWD